MASVRKDTGSGWVKCQDELTWINLDCVTRINRVENDTDDWDIFAYILGGETDAAAAKQKAVAETITEDVMDEIWESLQDSMQVLDVPAIIDGGTDGGAPDRGSGLGHGWVLCDDEDTLLNIDNVTRIVRSDVNADPDTFALTAYILGDETNADVAETVVIVTEAEEDPFTAVIDALEESMQLVKIVEEVDTEA